jgi:antirestriction protein ArdC
MKAEKKEKIQKLRTWLANLSDEQKAELIQKLGIVTVEGRPLSGRNQMILFAQNENVSVVAGYKQWQKAGKQVKKGETALIIFVPSVSKTKIEDSETKEGEAEEEENINFYPANVFDVSQVEDIQTEEEPAEAEELTEAPHI